jgi:hypothetical protein
VEAKVVLLKVEEVEGGQKNDLEKYYVLVLGQN